jgi:HEAT repeat protein
MNRSLIRLPVCLFFGWSLAFGQPSTAPAPTAAEVREQMRRLDPKNGFYERLKALAWINQRLDSPQLDQAIPALERCLKDDPEPEVRKRTIDTLAGLQLRRKRPCPLALIEAMLSQTDVVRWQAGIWVDKFKEFASGSIPILLRGVRSEDPDIRGNILFPLAQAAREDEKLLAVIRDCTKDKDWKVRDCAHIALYHATDQVDDFLIYLARERQAAHKAGPVRKQESAEEKRLREQRNDRMIGAAGLIREWLDSRPIDVGRVLCRMLENEASSERGGAAILLGEFANIDRCVKSKSKRGDIKDSFPSLAPLEENTPEEQAERTAQLAKQMRELGVIDRLTKIAEKDPEKEVRQAAQEALQGLRGQRARP